jgi:hypothetical protein
MLEQRNPLHLTQLKRKSLPNVFEQHHATTAISRALEREEVKHPPFKISRKVICRCTFKRQQISRTKFVNGSTATDTNFNISSLEQPECCCYDCPVASPTVAPPPKAISFKQSTLGSFLVLIIMAANLAKAAAVGALAAGYGNTVPECPNPQLPEYHHPDVCLTKPSRPPEGQPNRWMALDALKESGLGATMVPNTQTVVCPMEVQSLENPSATKGLDTTWIVENTSQNPVVVSWVLDGIEYSPFDVEKSAMEDARAILKPGEWTSVPTWDSFVYHVREIDKKGAAGKVVLQVRIENASMDLNLRWCVSDVALISKWHCYHSTDQDLFLLVIRMTILVKPVPQM